MDEHHHHHDDHHHRHHHHDECTHHHDHGRESDGPDNTDFLDLEISQAIYGGARDLKIPVVMDIIRQAMRERLQERLGPELAAIGRIAADEIADDIQVSAEIEARIARRQEHSDDLLQRVRSALGGKAAEPSPLTPAARRKAGGSRKRGRRR